MANLEGSILLADEFSGILFPSLPSPLQAEFSTLAPVLVSRQNQRFYNPIIISISC